MKSKIFFLIPLIFFLTSCENAPSYSQTKKWIRKTEKILRTIEKERQKKPNGVYKKGDTLEGKVVKVFDGDTYEILVADTALTRIRMAGIDAPEAGMPYYKRSTNYLKEMCIHKEVKTVVDDIDRYGRVVAYTYLPSGDELGEEMIRAGFAWHYKQYSKSKHLANLEKEARVNKLGLWADPNAKAPWDIRRLRRQGVSAKDSIPS